MLIVLYYFQLSSQGSVDQNRVNDDVYQCTTEVVRAVMDMTRTVQQKQAVQYVDLVMVSSTCQANTKHFYNIYTMLDHREDVCPTLYKCYINCLCLPGPASGSALCL